MHSTGSACDIDAVEFTHDLRVFKAGTGRGTVTSEPAGIDCGDHCIANYAPGTVVTLTATISHNSIFLGWSGACTGTEECVVTVDDVKTVTASFKFPYDVYLPLSVKN